MNSNQETLSSSADVKGTVAKPATDLGNLPVTTTVLVTMDPHIELELLRIDHRITIDQINPWYLRDLQGDVGEVARRCERDFKNQSGEVVVVQTIASYWMGPGYHFGRDRARVAIAPPYMSTSSRPRNSDIDPKGVPHLFEDVAAYDKRLQQGQRIESEDVKPGEESLSGEDERCQE
ncbi:hypothetical protein BTUL_0196g00150 [Botrytis tulipae]|uniref:Uncharacterized protein n=1 Tax=Botrytis tulipae TaxID=87230 RepID=A0A4Z1EBA6_9HELO|nr:hypothetical protein BTUL_0196g00150 [Botrytis tulipae]